MSAANPGFANHHHDDAPNSFSTMAAIPMHHNAAFPHPPSAQHSFYGSSHTSASASASSSSLADQLSDHESSYSSSSFEPQRDAGFTGTASGSASASGSGRSGPGPSSSSLHGFPCPNCGKAFARDDLLRRHLAREARALAQPSFDRQKSCYECARSKARCDLEVPTCGRCRARGKQCQYAPRSGNPNVRKARNASVVHTLDAPIQAMTPHMQSAMPPAAPIGQSPMPHATWPMNTPDFHMASSAFMTPNPNYTDRRADIDYDSQSESETHSWHEPASSASGSAFGSPRSQHSVASQPDSAPPNLSNFSIAPGHPYATVAPPLRTDSPHSFHDLNLDADAAPAPTRMPARKSSGFSRTNTGPIVTNMDRANVTFANDEGEQTPIVRLNNHLAHAATDPTKMQPSLNNNSNSSSSNSNFLVAPHSRHRTTSLPEALENSLPDDTDMHEAWNARSSLAPAAFGSRDLHAASAQNAMMPPPRPPALITSNLGARGAWPNPSPVRSGVFQHGIDLSGWLAEPVVPSPLYRMGPSLHSAVSGNFAAIGQSPIVETPVSARFAASLAHTMGLSTQPGFLPMLPDAGTSGPAAASAAASASASEQALSRSVSETATPPQSRYDCEGRLVLPVPQLPNAKQWWIEPDQSGAVAASIAQASAAHFVSYPALMVLTDPTAPIPPFIHRKWLHENRARIPESLASARSLLAGYYVRLPGGQSFVWRLIAEQIRLILATKTELCGGQVEPVRVFGAVASLWMYLVLIVFTDEAAMTEHVNSELLESALLGLSELSLALHAHTVEVCKTANVDEGVGAGSLARFGWVETLVRTLFAAYSLLVLQRFRENADEACEKLAGSALICDLPLPAPAAEFEADNEADWLQAHTAIQDALKDAGAPWPRPSLRQLVALQKDHQAGVAQDKPQGGWRGQAWIESMFDNHDEFTNVVLSVAFALDDSRV